jgi:hypothetical protein
MRLVRVMAAIAGLFLISGATASTRAEDGEEGVTIFTPRLSGDHFVCSAVNVSKRTLEIDLTVLGVDGKPLNPLPGSDENPTPKFTVQPQSEAEIDLRFSSGIPPTDGYCQVDVLGTNERNEVRVDLQVYWTKPIIPGTTKPIIQLARTVQGY